MRKLLTLLIFTGIMFSAELAKSQVSNPYLDSTSTWYEFFGGSNGITIYKDYNKYFFDGDTIISGNNYFKLYCNQIDSVWDAFNQNFITVNYYNHVYQGGLREDSLKRFYLMYQSQTIESFLFDFNLSIGDSLPNMNSNYGCNNPPNTVTNIDTVYLGSQVLQKFHFPPSLFNKMLYEGIGSSGGLIWSGTLCQAIEVGGCLIAYKKGLDSLYINCGLGITGISDATKKVVVNIFPNPASGYFTINFSDFINKGSVDIYNALGENVFTDKIYFTPRKEINLKNISSGIYFIRVIANETIYCKKLIVD